MKRPLKALLAVFIAGAVIPGIASAKNIQVGATKSPVIAPTCPVGSSAKACTIVLDKMTALESKRDGLAYPTTITSNGMISSLTVGVSAISSNKATVRNDVTYLDNKFGGAPKVQLTVLRPVGKPSLNDWRVAAKSPAFPVNTYLGKVVELPLIAPLAVVRGEVLALTVPTWAPVLSIKLSSSAFSYRQALGKSECGVSAPPPSVQNVIGEFANYGCSFTGTRVEYSALEITSPA